MKSISPPAAVAFAIVVVGTMASPSSRLRPRSEDAAFVRAHSHAGIVAAPSSSSFPLLPRWGGRCATSYSHRSRRALFGRHGIHPVAMARSGGTTNDDGDASTSNDDDATVGREDDDDNGERALSLLVLLTVPLSWGTYAPAVKYMYDVVYPPMPGLVFSAGYYVIAALTLGVLSRMNPPSTSSSAMGDEGKDDSGGGDRGDGNDYERDDDARDGDGGVNDDGGEITATSTITTRGGWELGGYLFVGNGLQVVGLQTVPADRAAFLVQLTTVMVPLLSAIFAGTLSAVPSRTWVACLFAFVGVVVMGADDSGHVSGVANVAPAGRASAIDENVETIAKAASSGHPLGAISFPDLGLSQGASGGDVLIVLAALAYTMHVVRLGVYAPRTNPLQLASSKASTEAILSVTLCAWLVYVGNSSSLSDLPIFVNRLGGGVAEYFSIIATKFAGGGSLESFWGDSSFSASVGAILWTGWITCAYTIYAQSYGQRKVGPSDSNLIYSTQPLFSSLFAYLLLGETLGPYGYLGATLIGMSLWLVSSASTS